MCGVPGAERDPDFAKNAAAVLNKRKKVIVYCGRGGTIEVLTGSSCLCLHATSL